MAYSDFTLEQVTTQFSLTLNTYEDYFASVPAAPISDLLRQTLARRTARAIAMGNEKARSELLIVPILLEAVEAFPEPISFFSGQDFSPDPARGLRGACDYLICLSPNQLLIQSPVVAVAEAKREDISTGWGQCLAEMVGAQAYNQAHGSPFATVYGIVTIGTIWRFLRLIGTTVYMDKTEYYLNDVEHIVSILLAMLHEAAASRQVSETACKADPADAV